MNKEIVVIQLVLIIILIIAIITLLRLIRTLKLERQISKYSLRPLKDNSLSFFDYLFNFYYLLQKKINKRLSKSIVLVNYSKHYQKYTKNNRGVVDPMNFITDKIVCSIVFIFIVVLSDVFHYNNISFIQLTFSLLLGFFIPDIFLVTFTRYQKKKVENDLLKAVIIMNNSFKSGHSIMQAIKIVATQIDEPLKDEFKKMYIDLTYGMDVDVVFKRFSERVNLKEAKYMTTSLTILNETGGDIVKVFASIERSFFNRKKLQQELSSLTASAALMFKILVVIPLFVVGMIVMLNPSYFNPFIKSVLGVVILSIIVILYISYIVIIKKIMIVGDVNEQ